MATIRTRVTNTPTFRRVNDTNFAKTVQGVIRRSLGDAKRAATLKIKSRYTIPPSKVTRAIKITARGLSGKMSSQDSKPFNLAEFLHRPKSRMNPQPSGGVYSEVKRGRGEYLKTAWLKYKPGAIFRRTGKARTPFKTLKGPSAVQLLNSAHVTPYILQKLEQAATSNLQKALPPVVSKLVI